MNTSDLEERFSDYRVGPSGYRYREWKGHSYPA